MITRKLDAFLDEFYGTQNKAGIETCIALRTSLD